MSAMNRVTGSFEQHPVLGLIASGLSMVSSWFVWFVQHADDFGRVFALGAAVFGCVAGWYSMRVMRRAWKRGDKPTFEP